MNADRQVDGPPPLLEQIYKHGALHIVAEPMPDGSFRNLYTTVIYGTENDLRSTPRVATARMIGEFLAIRWQRTFLELQELIAAGEGGTISIDARTIRYDVEPPVVGFRRGMAADRWMSASMWHRSLWCRERAAMTKSLADLPLNERFLSTIVEKLRPLDIEELGPVPIARFPEKLGDLDEFWPSPIHIYRTDGETVTIDVHSRYLGSDHRISGRAILFHRGLESHHLEFTGASWSMPQADRLDLTVNVDGFPMYATSGMLIKSVPFNLGIGAEIVLRVGTEGRRDFSVPVAPRTIVHVDGGRMPRPSTRFAAESLGRKWRDQGAGVQDSERVFVPGETDTDESIFRDIQKFAQSRPIERIYAVDRYGLDDKGLAAVAAIAAGHQSGITVKILTRFLDDPELERHVFGETEAHERKERFARIARHVGEQLQIQFRLFDCQGMTLHDRFLIIDERVWLVGHSFNAIGKALSALSEMRDLATKTRLLDVLDRLFASSPEIAVPT